jgi:DNA-directed RNA polymerase subunit RPC12/RpoP
VKTYSQVQKEKEEARLQAQQQDRDRRQKAGRYLDEQVMPRAIALHPDASEKSRENLRRRIQRSAEGAAPAHPYVGDSFDGDPMAADVACDHCGTEIFVVTPRIVTLAGSRYVQCPGCGWSGHL